MLPFALKIYIHLYACRFLEHFWKDIQNSVKLWLRLETILFETFTMTVYCFSNIKNVVKIQKEPCCFL